MNISSLLADRKVRWFAGFGAAGCLLAALVGELWLKISQSSPVRETAAICLLLDTSGSMTGGKIHEMKTAAVEFIKRRDFAAERISVVGFDTRATIASPLTQSEADLERAIQQLQIGGGTNMSDGLAIARSVFPAGERNSFVLLFTDGIPDNPNDALQAAAGLEEQGIKLAAIATGDADVKYLGQVTGDPQRVFPAGDGQFGVAFERAEKVLPHLVGSSTADAAPLWEMSRIGVWTALLASGVGLALIAGQNLYLRRQLPTRQQALTGGRNCAVVGLIAGIVGQLLFQSAADRGLFLVVLGRMVGWTLMGGLVGMGLAWFVPNLKPLRGLLGGGIGGASGVIFFLLLGAILGDAPGRLIGAAALGFWIGAMIALLEAVLREAWLEVEYGPGETRKVSLGREPIVIGGDSSRCTIFIRNAAPVLLEYTLKDGDVICRDVPHHRETKVLPGDKRIVEGVVLRVVAAETSGLDGSASRQHNDRARGVPPEAGGQNEPAATAVATSNTPTGTLQILIQGRKIGLTIGTRLRVRDLPGLESATPEKEVAEVVANPQDVSVLGLKNLMESPWESHTAEGLSHQIAPGRSIKLATGTRIRFGGVAEGVIL